MEQYKTNVATVMAFLKSEGFSPSTISLHKLCYQDLEEFLVTTNQSYSFDTANQWIAVNQVSWNCWRYTGYKHCIKQLEDVFRTGHISADHLCFRKPPYDLLIPELKETLNSFIHDCGYETDNRYRISCARFLLYMQNRGLNSIKKLDYGLLLDFHKEDYHVSQSSKNVYEDLIRVFLRHMASNSKCSIGFSLALNKLIIPQIIRLSEDELKKHSVPDCPKLAWEDVLRFLAEMQNARYGKSVLKSSKHILTLLYIFLAMHQTGINADLVWYWFHKAKPLLKTNWKQHRRTLCQFLIFLDTRTVTTEITGNPEAIDSIETLPDWEKSALSAYLAMLKREGWQPSTIAMHRSSSLRFCRYLNSIGIQRFDDVTPENVKEFNLNDAHETPEGKAAYNCRIRNFIIYLYEQGLINNPYLYKVLPTMAAPRTSIVKTLSKEEAASIWAIDPDTLSKKELRDYAIVCIGLSMGFRASDIVSLRFSDVDWKNRSIHIIQQKTGKALTMPMPVKTGNIIFRYIRDGRPESASPYIFIRHEAPYDKIKPGVCQNALKRLITHPDGSDCSFHAVRKTFATNLLVGGTNIALISDSLGHSTDGTVHRYLSLDEERMRMCPLSLADTGISCKGGVFHA